MRYKSSFRRAFLARVKEKGGFSAIYERIASGETVTKIAEDYQVSRWYLMRALRDGEDMAKLYADAQREAASAHAERGMLLLDELVSGETEVSKEEIALAKERAGFRRWLASKLDKETFGDTPLLAVTQTFGQIHLEALKAPLPAPQQLPAGPVSGPALPPAKEADYEVLPEVASNGKQPEGPTHEDDRARTVERPTDGAGLGGLEAGAPNKS